MDEEYDRYLDRMPGARRASAFDSTYAAQMHLLHRVLTMVDMALTDECLPVAVRRRVTRTVLYGSPDPAEAESRIRHQKRLADLMAEGMPYPMPSPGQAIMHAEDCMCSPDGSTCALRIRDARCIDLASVNRRLNDNARVSAESGAGPAPRPAG